MSAKENNENNREKGSKNKSTSSKRSKDTENNLKKQVKESKKMLNRIINYPFNSLFQIGALIGILYFSYSYFGNEVELKQALLNSFLYFTAIYLGLGLLYSIVIYFIAHYRIKDEEEKKRLKEEQMNWEREKMELQKSKYQEELRMAELRREEELKRFRELNQKKANELPPREGISYNDFMSGNDDGGNYDYQNQELVTEDNI
ncbi:MAG: CCDC34 family protein [Candidatus Kapabacteria bacterium]|nr:CCDC34 family protein [Candidatus Kapabacteria bacterium]